MSLTPGALSTPDETSTARRPRQRDRLGDICRAEAAREHERHAAGYASRDIPVEGSSVATGPSRAGRRLCVEQDHVGAARVLLRSGSVIGRRDRNGLNDRPSKFLLDCRDAFRNSVP